uniref:Uncharacterized protein n=1 Tax=Mesocestoides corti TaxID=53468 RepID=A0A5K3FMU2_MESCO
GRRHIEPRWSQPIVGLSAFQWHARKISSYPEKDTNEMQCIMSGVASVGSGILQKCITRAQTYRTTSGLANPISLGD